MNRARSEGLYNSLMTPRYTELDSLRGLAALTVFFHHGILISILFGALNRSNIPPMLAVVSPIPKAVVWAGQAPVILFFVLSGFVLSLPWVRGRNPAYGSFAVKRICRIWVPYLAALGITLALRIWAANPGRLAFDRWEEPISAALAFNLVGLIGVFDPGAVNTAIWTLTQEMRISLVYPLILRGVSRASWKPVVVCAATASVGALVIRRLLHLQQENFLYSVHYATLFVVGYLAARYQPVITRRRSPWMLPLGLLLFTYGAWFFPGRQFLHSAIFNDWSAAAGSFVLILTSTSESTLGVMLRWKVPAWLGKVSYSFYLLHLPILDACLLHFSVPVAIAIALPAALLAAELSYRWIERPAIALGAGLVAQPVRVAAIATN
jgi:peptidoglycan/LPS O-acetylase OafA/YrhL